METFWDSVNGQQLAGIMKSALIKLSTDKRQYTKKMRDIEVSDYIIAQIESGGRYVGHFSNAGYTTVIMEK